MSPAESMALGNSCKLNMWRFRNRNKSYFILMVSFYKSASCRSQLQTWLIFMESGTKDIHCGDPTTLVLFLTLC